MAAVLESVLLGKVDIKKVVGWLKHVQDNDQQGFGEFEVTFHKQEFVPFLLNFLRDQSSHALTHGPATPAKTPNRPRAPAPTQDLSDKKGCRSTGGSRGASRVQLFSPTTSVSPSPKWEAAAQSGAHSVSGVSAFSSPSFSTTWSPANRPSAQRLSLGDFMASPPELQQSPTLHPQKGRRKGGRGGHSDETLYGDTGGKRSAKAGGGYGRINERTPPSSNNQINLNNMDDFPPIGSSPVTPAASKPSRRINPTPVSAERSHSKPKSCFTSTPFSHKSRSPSGDEANDGSVMVTSLSLQEERELLKQEKTKRAQQMGSPLLSSVEPSTPTKSGMMVGSKVPAEGQMTCPEPSKVIFSSELDLLAEVYCTCISENLVPNIFLELFFVMQLLTSWSPHNHEDGQKALCVVQPDVLERCYLRQVHNCVYFAVKVLENQFQLVSQLDKCTLRMLAENERVTAFSPDLKDRLVHAQDRSTAKLSPSVSMFIHSVPFQPATDNRSNFGNDKAFHTFKKQRDVFYELLREWEDFHKEPGWNFDHALGSRIRGMMGHLTSAGNHSHFARLFLKQLVQMCKGPGVGGSFGDAPDADLLGMLGADSLGRLKRLEERLIQPHAVVGPCPPPAFPGHQEFFRDFLQTASCCQLNQHLQDSLCQQLLQLDEVSILRPSAPIGEGEEEEEDDGDMEQQDEKQRFSSVLLHARLLAKFLGFICFLPYQTSERASREIQETAVTMRSKSVPVLDVCGVLTNSIKRRRSILTVPWMVEFLSMMEFVGPLLLSYRTALGTLLLFYRRLHLVRCEEMCYLNKVLLVSVLGWLFQIPAIPEDIFYTSAFTDVAKVEDSDTSATGLDCIPLVDQQLLYTCCPFLGEFRKLLAAFVSGSTAKSGGIIRKITPTSAELKDSGAVNRTQQKLQVDLEQAFFHNQPPSLRRTVEFVAERVGSNAVKHMKATLVSELVENGEKMLKDGLNSPNSNSSKLNEAICAQLCDAGLEALGKATSYCCEKSPEAIRTLLPEESSPTVLTTAENITKRLAAEKACSWLSANITALVRREWKSRFDRVMKATVCSAAPELSDSHLITSTSERSISSITCPAHCPHQAPRPSHVLVQIKELLSIAVGPRNDEDLPTFSELSVLLHRVELTLSCRKFLTVVSEQMLLSSTVLLVCKLVSAELPLSECGGPGELAGGGDSGSDSVTALLEQFVDLWERTLCSSAPLHQLFSTLTISAVLRSGNPERRNYLLLVRELVDRGLLREDEVISHWTKLTDQTLPVELIENFQLQSKDSSPLALAEVQSHFDALQVSHQTVDGAT